MTTTRLGSAGTLLGGRYRLLEPLPGAGRSWRARDEIDDRPLLARAIELPGGLPDAERQQARQRALREAAVVARVQHPGVAPVVDAVVEDGAPWVISVLPPGRSLGEIVADEGPVSPVAAALVGLQVLDALAAAGVPHGELTPYDVVIAEDGRVRVTGFATTPLGAVGTRGFGAPEGGTGPAADLWALGVTLHVAVEGRMPGGARPGAGALGPALDALLARDPEDRSDPGPIRPLLVEAAGEPQDPPPPPVDDVHDPEVAAALAAFDAAITSRPARARPATQADGTTPVRTSQTVADEPTTAPDPTPQAVVAAPAAPAPPTAAPDKAPSTDANAATEPGSARRTEAVDTDATPDQPTDAAVAAAPATRTEAVDGADTDVPGQPTDAATSAAPAPPTEAADRAGTAPAPDRPTDAAAPAAPAAPAPPTEAAGGADTDDTDDTDTDTPDQPTKAATTAAPAAPTEAADGAETAPAPNRPIDAATTAAPAAPTEAAVGAPEQAAGAAASASRTEAVDGAGGDVAPDRTPPPAATPPPVTTSRTVATSRTAATSRTGATAGGATAPTGPRRPPEPAPLAAPAPADRPPAPDPGPRIAAPAGRRRLIGAGIVAAVLAAVLIPVLLNRGDDNRGNQPPAAAATTATPQPTGTTASPDTPIPPPAGWQLYRDPAGWSIAVPVDWTATHRGTAVTFTKDDRTLRVTERTDPPQDTFAAAENLQPVIQAATPGFEFVRLANVTYRAWPTTDLEFRAGTATRTHSLIRSTVPNPRQVFDFTWTCLDRNWKEDRTFFDTALQTFDPGD